MGLNMYYIQESPEISLDKLSNFYVNAIDSMWMSLRNKRIH